MSSEDHLVMNIDKLLFDREKDKDLFEKLRKWREETSSNGQGEGSSKVTKIQRVHNVMKDAKKDCWKEYFEPKAIAIGPIHARSKNLSVRKQLTLMWAAKYLDGLKGEEILEGIRREIDSLMGHFEEKCLDEVAIEVNQNEYVYGTLPRMLFLDGCAMLQFIYSFMCDDFVKDLRINAGQATLVLQDLFLLENQIPFRVLQIIMKGGKNKQQKEKEEQKGNKSGSELTKMEEAVQMFIHMSNMSTAAPGRPDLNSDDIVHLLDLLRRSLLDDPCSAPSDDCSNWAFNGLRSFVKYSVFVIFKLPFYVLRFLVCLAATIVVLLSFIIYMYTPFLKSKDPCNTCLNFSGLFLNLCMYGFGIRINDTPITRRSFRNVQELKAAGIELKPSKSRSLKNVSFRSGLFGGCLRLCPIRVDKSTEFKLLNLIAYEMCTDGKSNDYEICSYINFLDTLIDNEQDVKDLRAANILRHRLSSDKEVADLFNNICPISVADKAYGDVKSAIEEYYEWKIPIWITDFRREHLSSPWTLLALIAAAAALGLTATQTYFAINPR